MRLAMAFVCFAFTVGCASKQPASEFARVEEEAVYKLLSFSPVSASGQGLHRWNGHDFDVVLDDFSSRNIEQQRNYVAELHKRLNAFDPASLSPEDRADFDILNDQIGLMLFDIDIAASWRHSPQSYVELVGTALFNPLTLEYAGKEERFRHIIARLQKLPAFLETARRQLYAVPPIWAKVAAEENDGNIGLVDKVLREAVPEHLKDVYAGVASPALDSLRAFNRFLQDELPKRGGTGASWRLGADNYALKFRLALATDRTPDQVLADAENRVKEVHARMLEIANPLHKKWFGAHPDHPDQVVREVLDHIAQDHSTPASYMDDTRRDLDQARDFVREKNLLTLPAGSNLQVIPTPEFQRGTYSVGGFSPAPMLEPQLGAFFWLTPIPEDWPKERVESKLREYNFVNLQLLVIHEAMPGHYVQAEFANRIEPKTRRVTRSYFGNGPYVEGWAQYVTQVMLDEGYMNNSPELRLSLYKQELRADANAILDIRLQTDRMTDAQAMDLMERQTFQEHEEAVGKLQRAKLGSTQLPTYFTGWRDWLRLRTLMQKSGSFTLRDFHDRALKEGAVPLPVLARLLTGKDLN